MAVIVELPVSVPELRAVRWTSDALHAGVKDYYAVGRVERGRCEWWGRGKVWRSAPGCIQIKQPGDVHRDLARDGATTWTMIALPANEVARAREAGKAVAFPQLEADDARAEPFRRLLDAVCAGAEPLVLEVVLAEAISAFATISKAKTDHTRPVRRAMEYLRERMTEPIRLDVLARHAELDKFHLCRAFRAQVGMPPHTYLIQLRVARAKELLSRGVRASEVAPLVGFYDQAQLTRHFRRIVGTTPARYGRGEGERGDESMPLAGHATRR
ncbi:AraC family transcriptional regulator [Nannocystis sp. RBIL2]|uniref:helix-turn-helix domain-containing protein n=1 Tax=Nannocystis sp. RBIL2 TaxID=2996788 RepID=UPI00226F7785|nr:AraC family transcriptional regulator [Nannocystis sp. RBIL2]MCY1071961.1 AraC family transcriptional regulator [Nannocystis sp. RBIL2]